MGNYTTRQKKSLIRFFARYREESFSIDEILLRLPKEDDTAPPPGRSTLYRLSAQLTAEGVLRRFFPEGEHKCRYQFLGGKPCEAHLHMKCTGCGMLFHLDDTVSENIVRAVWNGGQFSIDKRDTILFGTCANCRKRA